MVIINVVNDQVKGEVYLVDDAMLGQLDILEDHPTYYRRRHEEVVKSGSEETLSCWVYILVQAKEEMMSLPLLSEYRSKGDHGRPYVPREERENLTNYYSDVKS